MVFCQVFFSLICTLMSVSIFAHSSAKVLTTCLFVVSFNFLFYLAYKNVKKFPSFSILSALLWLGFFGKTTLFLTFGHGIKDPIGAFNNQWDELFTLVFIGVFGLNLAIFFCIKFFPNYFSEKLSLEKADLKIQFNLNIKMIVIFLVCLVTLAFLNLKFGFILSGLTSVTQMPFKINALIGWMFYLGFSLILAQFFLSAVNSKKLTLVCLGLLFAEGFFSSVALISRGTFVFHVIPVLAIIAYNKNFLYLSYKNLVSIFFVLCGALFITVGVVTMARNTLYNKYAFSNSEFSSSFLQNKNKIDLTFINNSVEVIGDLLVNRWVGLEGSMAVVSYPEKSFNLFFDSLLRIPKVGVQDVYAKISGLVYEENSKISFSFIPGPIAFLYYSGNFILVFLGLFFLGILLILSDEVIWRSFKNPVLTIQISTYLAVNASQIGISPLPLLKSLALTAFGLLVLFFILRVNEIFYFLVKFLRKIPALRILVKNY